MLQRVAGDPPAAAVFANAAARKYSPGMDHGSDTGEVAPQAFEYRPLDDDRIVIEGRLRSQDADRILRDDPMIWAFDFRDGLLRRSTPEGAPSVRSSSKSNLVSELVGAT